MRPTLASATPRNHHFFHGAQLGPGTTAQGGVRHRSPHAASVGSVRRPVSCMASRKILVGVDPVDGRILVARSSGSARTFHLSGIRPSWIDGRREVRPRLRDQPREQRRAPTSGRSSKGIVELGSDHDGSRTRSVPWLSILVGDRTLETELLGWLPSEPRRRRDRISSRRSSTFGDSAVPWPVRSGSARPAVVGEVVRVTGAYDVHAPVCFPDGLAHQLHLGSLRTPVPPGRVTGRSQTKPRHTYAAGRPSTATRPESSGMSSRGPSATTTTAPGCCRATSASASRSAPAGPTTATSSGTALHRLGRGQRPAGEPGRLLGQGRDGGERLLGDIPVAALAGQRVGVDQRVDHRREAGRAGVVAGIPRPGHQGLGVGRGVEEAAVVGAEPLDRVRRAASGRGPARPRRRWPGRVRGSRTRRSRGPPARPRARPTTPSRETRRSRPSTTCTRHSSSPAATAASTYAGSPSRSPASQRPVMASPFQAATTLSSRAGRTRCARASSSRRRTSSSRARVLEGRPARPGVAGWSCRARRCRLSSPRGPRPPRPRRPRRAPRRAPAVTRRRTCPRPPRCRRPARRRSPPSAVPSSRSMKSAVSRATRSPSGPPTRA